MNEESKLGTYSPDPAAVFACALSLWNECRKREDEKRLNISESYNGADQFMRELMHIAEVFETWACQYIDFEYLEEVWPYLLKTRFGSKCVAVLPPTCLADFTHRDCLRVALQLRLPVKVCAGLPVPVRLVTGNPNQLSAFKAFRIQTVREWGESDCYEAFTVVDDPYDEEYGPPCFALYGIGDSDLSEHIADRWTYREILTLARNLSPGIEFPDAPRFHAG